ncbi:MAG: type II toxin-antitoxin system VapC family toxin [Steroidobacteraceae bacterium]
MLYLDTSVLVSLLIPEADSPVVRNWIEGQLDEALTTSDWALVEFASAMGIKVRQKALKARQAEEAIGTLGTLAADSLVMQAPTRAACSHAVSLAARFREGLRAGDALHLAVAMEAGADSFATLDRNLAAAAKALRLPLRIMDPAARGAVR